MDRLLIEKIISGNKGAFQTLFSQYIDKALRTAVAVTKNQELAKDAVQETFIRIYKNLHKYDPGQPFDPWFYRILLNECHRLLRKESKVLTLNEPDVEIKIAEQAREDFSDLYQAVQSLKDIYRIPVILKYLQGFSEKEIAQILALNQNTVKSRLFKGREQLKKELKAGERGARCGY